MNLPLQRLLKNKHLPTKLPHVGQFFELAFLLKATQQKESIFKELRDMGFGFRN